VVSASVQFSILLFVTGWFAGRLASVWAAALVDQQIRTGLKTCDTCGAGFPLVFQLIPSFGRRKCRRCGSRSAFWPVWVSITTALIFTVFGWLLVEYGCQTVTEVRPSRALWQNRLPFQLLFIFLLTTATIADLLDYIIPDGIVLPGTLIGIAWATLSGELQVIHAWVDWDYEFAELYGQYIPEWMKQHQHLHGFVWSICGALTGAGLMWAGRVAARLILGIPAIGFGDVTLMAMIGAWLGWQPTLCALTIAPLVGIVLGLGTFAAGRKFVAFGPSLCIAALIVLCTWRVLWETMNLKMVFSHWPSIAGMVAVAFATFCALLFALRIFRAIPASRLR
jgi:prepilin signal peptidase PulO-like enzyme (type II secretory pathway)